MSKIVLRECPFCGPRTKDDELVQMLETRTTGADSYTLGYTIRCNHCGIEMHDEYEDEVAKRWNRRASDPVTAVRCSECGWIGESTDLGAEGECGGEGCPGTAVSELADPAAMINAWQESEGQYCGKQLADAGLIAPRPSTANEASALDMEPGDTVWDLTEAGEAALNAARAA